MFKIYYQISKYNKNHSLICKTRKKKAHSFLHHFSQMLSYMMGGDYPTVHIAPNGDSFGVNNLARNFSASDIGCGTHAANNRKYSRESLAGIIIGTGDIALDINNYDLSTRIIHGITTGTLEYFNCGVRAFSISSGTNTGSFELFRFFRNSSDSSITIKEIGVFQEACVYTGAPYDYESLLTIRDLVSPGFQIDSGEYMKVTYTFQIVS